MSDEITWQDHAGFKYTYFPDTPLLDQEMSVRMYHCLVNSDILDYETLQRRIRGCNARSRKIKNAGTSTLYDFKQLLMSWEREQQNKGGL